jgi:mono/diheme cytochrome c family protein
MRKSVLMRAVLAGVSFIVVASGSAAQRTDYLAMSGQALYERFCASCHGTAGRGDGPVAASLSVQMPDLTLMARRANGSYPRERVERIIDGRYIIGAHGSRTMPVWGEDLSRLYIGDPEAERSTRMVIDRLTDYVGTLQRPGR